MPDAVSGKPENLCAGGAPGCEALGAWPPHRSIALTTQGERLFRSADGAVQQLQDVLGEIQANQAHQPVTLSASIGVTGLWVLPRLNRLQKMHPGIDLRVSANNRVADLRHEGIDLAIRYTTPSLAPAGSIRLFGHTIAPVAHPSLSLKSLRSAQGLSKLCWLEFDEPHTPWLRWSDWLAAAGWPDAKPQRMLHFNQYDQVIQAALEGQGVALGRLELIAPLLDSRALSAAVPAPAPSGLQAWLLANSGQRKPSRRCAPCGAVDRDGSACQR